MAGEKWGAVVEVVEERLFGGQRRLKRRSGRSVRRGYNGADYNYKKLQSAHERQQRRRTTMAGERQGVVVEAEERLLCGGGGFMVRSWRLERAGQAGRAGGCSLFVLFFAGSNPSSILPSTILPKNRGDFLDFWGVFT